MAILISQYKAVLAVAVHFSCKLPKQDCVNATHHHDVISTFNSQGPALPGDWWVKCGSTRSPYWHKYNNVLRSVHEHRMDYLKGLREQMTEFYSSQSRSMKSGEGISGCFGGGMKEQQETLGSAGPITGAGEKHTLTADNKPSESTTSQYPSSVTKGGLSINPGFSGFYTKGGEKAHVPPANYSSTHPSIDCKHYSSVLKFCRRHRIVFYWMPGDRAL
ncbi:hypothetical protein L218DRAFT_948920 [Marasmius fiardii PR-910]|nr:hypothetical protein L218DRAFT_948920 [Marasmius fiardii PR-910]